MRRSFSSGGTLYASESRANFKFRRHLYETQYAVPANRCTIIPFLGYAGQNVESLTGSQKRDLTSYSGDTVEYYPTPYVIDGSRVRYHKIDLLIRPTTASDADVIEFYACRIACSFHDIKSGDVRGLQLNDQESPRWQNDAKNLSVTAAASSLDSNSPTLDWSKLSWDISYPLKHWWRGMRKIVMAAGQPVSYYRTERVPPKCVRANPGMFFGQVIMNDSPSSLSIDFKHNFDEVPLVQ